MIKIIDGIRYNTKTSTLIFKVNSIYPKSDIRWSEEYLYKTKSGKYFLHGIGGPGSPYAIANDIYTNKEGEKIIPMPFNQLVSWAEEYMPDEKLKILLMNIRQEIKRNRTEIPVFLENVYGRLSVRERYKKLLEVNKEKASSENYRLTYVDW
jgi:hypothetical protein